MATRTETLMAAIELAHDFRETGDLCQFEACGVISSDVCPICGLRRIEWSNGQNSPDGEFYERNGQEICLANAVTCRPGMERFV